MPKYGSILKNKKSYITYITIKYYHDFTTCVDLYIFPWANSRAKNLNPLVRQHFYGEFMDNLENTMVWTVPKIPWRIYGLYHGDISPMENVHFFFWTHPYYP